MLLSTVRDKIQRVKIVETLSRPIATIGGLKLPTPLLPCHQVIGTWLDHVDSILKMREPWADLKGVVQEISIQWKND